MSSLGQVLKSIGPKLVPFFKTSCIYFVLMAEQPSLLTACIKCLPIISLIMFVFLHGMSLSKEHTFSRRIVAGLVFSCFGDALIIWPNLFLGGMAMFAIAQIMYISAFGFKPLNPKIGAIIFALATIVTYILMPGLNGVLAIGVPIYISLLGGMTWRAISQVQLAKENGMKWTKLCSCIGGILFLISDTILGFHHFYHPIPYSAVSIMLTYYAAQLGIALSTVNSKNNNINKQVNVK